MSEVIVSAPSGGRNRRNYSLGINRKLMKKFQELGEKYNKLVAEFEKYKKESIKWSVEDFTSLEVEGWEITEENAQEALEEMISNHDCNYGITWVDLQCYITDLGYGTEVEIGNEKWRNENNNI